MNHKKYKRFETVNYYDRTWPNKRIEKAPIWVSVDLRDGNQALINPMTIYEKVEFFKCLCAIGFKQIEIGFPSSSQIEFDFLRKLVDDDLIPTDVTIQVLTQAREHLIKRTFEALKGVKKAIVHIYNSTSALQRKVVFQKTKEEIKNIAIEGVSLVKKLAKNFKGELILEYSPESFTGTEMDFVLEIIDEIVDVWDSKDKLILNLPATVEMDTPNIYADQIEYISKKIKKRHLVILSTHPHNDRGCAVASAELALLAGAERVEGTLFGNGERTGNVDIITLALNLLTHGIDPKLDFTNIDEIKNLYKKVTKMNIGDRDPYVGALVFTAFSGSHQDAINKGMKYREINDSKYWEVPYLPIDPADLKREYEPIIRINSQSGKGGVAFILEKEYGFILPKELQAEFSKEVKLSSEKGGELSSKYIYDLFISKYVNIHNPLTYIQYNHYNEQRKEISFDIKYKDKISNCIGKGNGRISAVVNALASMLNQDFNIVEYSEHSLTQGADSVAASYVQVTNNIETTYGVGVNNDTLIAAIEAVVSGVNRILVRRSKNE